MDRQLSDLIGNESELSPILKRTFCILFYYLFSLKKFLLELDKIPIIDYLEILLATFGIYPCLLMLPNVNEIKSIRSLKILAKKLFNSQLRISINSTF
jgi:hypothetical protein